MCFKEHLCCQLEKGQHIKVWWTNRKLNTWMDGRTDWQRRSEGDPCVSVDYLANFLVSLDEITLPSYTKTIKYPLCITAFPTPTATSLMPSSLILRAASKVASLLSLLPSVKSKHTRATSGREPESWENNTLCAAVRALSVYVDRPLSCFIPPIC